MGGIYSRVSTQIEFELGEKELGRPNCKLSHHKGKDFFPKGGGTICQSTLLPTSIGGKICQSILLPTPSTKKKKEAAQNEERLENAEEAEIGLNKLTLQKGNNCPPTIN